jgi:hypothetical protein
MINKSIEGRFSENPEGLSTHQRQRLGEISQYMDPHEAPKSSSRVLKSRSATIRSFT